MEKDEIDVVAGIINRDGKFLLCKRPANKRNGGFWEFPGGKCEKDESLRSALCRELLEELKLRLISTGEVLLKLKDDDSPYVIHFIEATVQGDPTALEHDEIRWVSPFDCKALPLTPTDRACAEYLQEHRAQPREPLNNSIRSVFSVFSVVK